MTAQTSMRTELVHAAPAQLEPGVLYYSKIYATTLHLCACGCGTETALPIGDGEWSIWLDENGDATLSPSIGQRIACKSHYFIQHGKVVWA